MDDAGRDTEEDSVVGTVAEADDDEAGEVSLERISHVVKEDGGDDDPYLRIEEGLFDLRLLVVGVLYACLVALQALDGDNALAVGKEFGCERRVGEDPPETDPEEDSDETKDHEHPLIREGAAILVLNQ